MGFLGPRVSIKGYGNYSSLPPGRSSHSLTVARCMLSKIEVGVASWIGGIGPGEYLSMEFLAGFLPMEEWSFSTSSRWSEMVGFFGGMGVVSWLWVMPRTLVVGALLSSGVPIVVALPVVRVGVSCGLG